MGAENGPSMETIANFNVETLSSSVFLSEKFQKAGVLGKKEDENQKDLANQAAQKIINSSFVTEKRDGFIVYDSVEKMIEIAHDKNKTNNQAAENALFQIGLALSLNNTVFKAVSEGNLEEVIPSNLHGIEPYVLNSYFTLGRDDKDGQELVKELVNVFRLKKRADNDPEYYRDDFKRSSKELFTKLLDKCDEASVEDENNGNKGRWENMIGYVRAINVGGKSKQAEKSEVSDEALIDRKVSSGGIRKRRTSTEHGDIKVANRYDVLGLIETETDVDKLTEIARNSLDNIERLEDLSNRYRMYGGPTEILDHISNRLEAELIPKAEKTGVNLEKYDLLRKEIKARLAIFDIGKLMEDVNFRVTEPGRSGMADVIDQAAKMDRVLDREVMNFCFKEAKTVGYDIASAWDLIQEANFNYRELLNKVWESGIDGVDRSRYTEAKIKAEKDKFTEIKDLSLTDFDGGLFMDRGVNRKRADLVDKYIISQLGENGKKTYQLANELVNATAERSSFNFGFIKGDSFSESIYFRSFREDDAKKGKKVGPIANRGIESLAHGWLRFLSSKEKDYLVEKMGAIKAENINIEEIDNSKKDSIMYFGKILPSYVLTTRNALMDTDPDLKKILNISWLQELTSAIDKVDLRYDIVKTADGYRKAKENDDKKLIEKTRCGPQDIKVFYVLGLFELFATKENLGFTSDVMKDFRRIFVDTNLSDTAKPFLSESQWNWCLEQEVAQRKGRFGGIQYLTFGQAMNVRNSNKIKEDFWDGFFGSIANKKKK